MAIEFFHSIIHTHFWKFGMSAKGFLFYFDNRHVRQIILQALLNKWIFGNSYNQHSRDWSSIDFFSLLPSIQEWLISWTEEIQANGLQDLG
jgi:hypothetical protein